VESARTADLLRVVLAVAEERSTVFAGADNILVAANAGVCRMCRSGFVALLCPSRGRVCLCRGGAERWCSGGGEVWTGGLNVRSSQVYDADEKEPAR
jgi:hypothetical protein